jgi:hypothetical protein
VVLEEEIPQVQGYLLVSPTHHLSPDNPLGLNSLGGFLFGGAQNKKKPPGLRAVALGILESEFMNEGILLSRLWDFFLALPAIACLSANF